jgi:hypothetical protein
MLKTNVVTTLCLVLVFSVLAACSGGNSGGNEP